MSASGWTSMYVPAGERTLTRSMYASLNRPSVASAVCSPFFEVIWAIAFFDASMPPRHFARKGCAGGSAGFAAGVTGGVSPTVGVSVTAGVSVTGVGVVSAFGAGQQE